MEKVYTKNDLKQALKKQRKDISDELEKIDKEKWNDAVHCTCLGHAIHQLKENDKK